MTAYKFISESVIQCFWWHKFKHN